MRFRRYEESDLESLVQVFTESVHRLGAQDYTQEQRHAWAPVPPSVRAWASRLERWTVLVAEDDERRMAGFLAYEAPADAVGSNDGGHIHLLYTAPSCARQRVATNLYELAEADSFQRGARALYTEASHLARPFFEKRGFVVLARETVERRGIELERWRMKKTLR